MAILVAQVCRNRRRQRLRLHSLRHALVDRVERLEDVVDGNPKKDIKGLRPRVEVLEDMAKKWRELSLMGKGLMVGLGFNLLATFVTLIAIWRLAAELASHTVP